MSRSRPEKAWQGKRLRLKVMSSEIRERLEREVRIPYDSGKKEKKCRETLGFYRHQNVKRETAQNGRRSKKSPGK